MSVFVDFVSFGLQMIGISVGWWIVWKTIEDAVYTGTKRALKESK